MNKREFWTTKSVLPQWETITFAHSAFDDTIRLVANVFDPVELAGAIHIPAPMTIKPPDVKGGSQPKLQVAFPRQVVGREFKKQLAAIAASGSREPITVTYALYLGDPITPQVALTLYASDQAGVSFSTEAVQVSATLDNPMRRSVALIYYPAVFTGLENLG
jgi:hypothetical protein